MQRERKLILSIAMITLLAVGGIFYFGGQGEVGASALSGTAFLEAYHTTQGATLLDVRTAGEFASGHIEGAMNLDFYAPNFADQIAALDRTTPYFVYCRSGNRSGQTVGLMKQLGFTNVTDLPGGVAGSPMVLE